MQIRQITGKVATLDPDLLVVPIFGEPGKDATFKALDKARDGHLREIAKRERFVGKPGQTLTVTGNGSGALRVLMLGQGAKSDFNLPTLRDIAARAARFGRVKGVQHLVLVVPDQPAKTVERAIELTAEGAILGAYKFDKYYAADKKKPCRIKRFNFIFPTAKGPTTAAKRNAAAAVKRGVTTAQAVCAARDFVNEPAAYMTPSQMASEARKIAKKHKLQVKILSAKDCEKLGMGMFLAVGRGSDQESKLIHLTYKPAKPPKKRVILIGKGVTFDSGGYSLKPSVAMEDMKIDMSGAAAVIAAMGAIGQLGSPYEIHAIAACCENLVSGRAYKLGDVLKAADGTTVEINNTDAEGRLTLGDALTYARSLLAKSSGKTTKGKVPVEMFDFATLTGACMVALGHHTAGVMSHHESLVKNWLNAAKRAGEDMWRLPLNERLREQLKSNIADMKNTGERYGGAITAGLFLKHFAKDTPWVHVDIAGPASSNREFGATPKGGTGFAVATMVEYLTR